MGPNLLKSETNETIVPWNFRQKNDTYSFFDKKKCIFFGTYLEPMCTDISSDPRSKVLEDISDENLASGM